MMEIDHGAFFREVELPEHAAQVKNYRSLSQWDALD